MSHLEIIIIILMMRYKKLLDLANLNNASLITTEKDYVKLANKYKELVICAKVDLEF